jgi:hypothetical protein
LHFPEGKQLTAIEIPEIRWSLTRARNIRMIFYYIRNIAVGVVHQHGLQRRSLAIDSARRAMAGEFRLERYPNRCGAKLPRWRSFWERVRAHCHCSQMIARIRGLIPWSRSRNTCAVEIVAISFNHDITSMNADAFINQFVSNWTLLRG